MVIGVKFNEISEIVHKLRIRAVNDRFGNPSHGSNVQNLSSEREFLRSCNENGDKGVVRASLVRFQ